MTGAKGDAITLFMPALSPTQTAALSRLAVKDFECPPDGYPTAGRDAVRWHRTMTILASRGLVVVSHNGGYGTSAKITDAGRETVRSLTA